MGTVAKSSAADGLPFATLARMRSLLAIIAICVGCSDGGDGASPQPDAGSPLEPDLTGPLYDRQRVIDVAIELPAADWDALRMQTRPAGDIFGTCTTGPRPSPFTWFRATKVTVDGVTIAGAGVRKKGFYGSLDEERPSFKIKTDEYVKDQQLFGIKSLTLNNAKQDPALVRQCLAFDVFARAGVPAPRCNFARVRVNGTSLGAYVNVESVGKPFLRRHFANDERNLYEGSISDFRPLWTETFDKKTNESDPSRADLDAIAAALAKPDAELLAALEPLVDIEQFLDYWAAEILIDHSDSYSGLANNFFVYDDPTSDKMVFMPWGVDQTFNDPGAPAIVANGLLARRLYLLPQTRDRYIARLRQQLDTVWKETELLAEVDRMAALIAAPAAEVDGVRNFIRTRRAELVAALASGPPPWTAPFKPNAKPCFEQNGDVAVTFDTRWGTLGAPDAFATGTGTMTGTIEGTTIATQRVGSMAGYGEQGEAIVQLIGEHANGTYTIVYAALPPTSFVAPADVAVQSAAVFRYTAATDTFEAIGFVFGGTIHFDAASTTDGQPVRGRMNVQTIGLPF